MGLSAKLPEREGDSSLEGSLIDVLHRLVFDMLLNYQTTDEESLRTLEAASGPRRSRFDFMLSSRGSCRIGEGEGGLW